MTKSYMTFQYSLEETIEELQEHITSLKSLLSKAKEENKELKGALKVTPGAITKEDLEWAQNTLASLKSKGEEE